MAAPLEITFAPLTAALEPTTVVFAASELALAESVAALNQKSGGIILKAADAASFKGKAKSSFEVLAPAKIDADRLIVAGAGKTADLTDTDWAMLGGYAYAQIAARKTARAGVIADFDDTGDSKPAEAAALIGFGALLRHYTFTKYKTSKTGSEDAGTQADGAETPAAAPDGLQKLVILTADPDKARTLFQRQQAVANGVMLARDLVNEPANMLGPVEFADRVKDLERLGLEVEILDEDQLKALKMNTLLSVSQGSVRPARVAIMQWNGAKSRRAKPICFVGKGVVFDTGGYSLKPGAGMEDMKGDMGGAAAVTGLMAALAERKANVNAIGLIGLVENMVSGDATRPGDVVTSMSGQTVEILNTDAEGRLVLADVLWYAQERYKPKLVIDLATLTGAIMIALGKEYAGLFANDDKLAADLLSASKSTGEKLWRMPLDKAFHRMIDGKTADIKNIGGRWAGSCTAAAFLERFIKDTPWAHLDVAGTAMDSGRTEINTSWGSGWGVRLLDRFVADHHEKS
ncbi:MAG: leucyl aminopeptidase [Hyphomicrobium sp.]|jgi:leucyl aminopeptidase|nr:leucyl aminopeptidase [Hyphomicrobium sp.]